ncbi:MAG: glycosyltransferase family 9 protein [Thermodesulfobacteriota bacterium]
MTRPRTVILVHKGALGDFLQVWPSLASLTRHWPDSSFLWAGREQYSLWTAPLGIQGCPGKLGREVDSLYSATVWPEGLRDCLLIWFGLKKCPLEKHFPGVWFVPGLQAGVRSPPRQVYAQGLAARGVPFHPGWLDLWRGTIAGYDREFREKGDVFLFPGAGHPKRCWPLDRFQALGQWLIKLGHRVCFVYGPAEKERGVRVKNFEPIFPENFRDLQDLLVRASLVVGNDSGPMHLAGYLGVPALALFGPAAPEQWGPYRVRTLKCSLECSPCSEDGVITCERPVCMQKISLESVKKAVQELQNDASC